MKLTDLIPSLTHRLVTDDRAAAEYALMGINPDDWPNSDAKRIAKEYFALREKKNHVYAEVKLEKELGKLGPPKELPHNSDIQRLYLEAINESTALELGKALIKHPDRGLELVNSFRFLSPKSDATHFAMEMPTFVRQMDAEFKAGNSIREIEDWTHLSRMIGGFNPGRVGLLVAKTGFGKTNLAASIALSASKSMSAVFVNMEMSEFDFAQRLMMSTGDLTYDQIKGDPAAIAEKLARIQEDYCSRHMFFTKGVTLSVFDIESLARRFKNASGLDILIIDYDQKIELKTSRETPEWKALQLAIESMERLAKELSIYCLVLAQESGDGDGRMSGSKRSAFPATSVLHFMKDEAGKNIIKATKNRFGKTGAAVEVEYVPEKSFVKEGRPYEANELMEQNVTGYSKKRSRRPAMSTWNPSGN